MPKRTTPRGMFYKVQVIPLTGKALHFTTPTTPSIIRTHDGVPVALEADWNQDDAHNIDWETVAIAVWWKDGYPYGRGHIAFRAGPIRPHNEEFPDPRQVYLPPNTSAVTEW